MTIDFIPPGNKWSEQSFLLKIQDGHKGGCHNLKMAIAFVLLFNYSHLGDNVESLESDTPDNDCELISANQTPSLFYDMLRMWY